MDLDLDALEEDDPGDGWRWDPRQPPDEFTPAMIRRMSFGTIKALKERDNGILDETQQHSFDTAFEEWWAADGVELRHAAIDTAAFFPKFDAAALLGPAIDTAAFFPKFDAAALLGPAIDTAAFFPKFDAAALLGPAIDTAAFFPRLDKETLEELATRFQPRNLRGIQFDYEQAWTIMEEEGLPFALVPDADSAALLMDARSPEERRRVLVQRRPDVLASCASILGLCVHNDGPVLGSFVRKAIAALEDDHVEAAQALATNIFDRLVKSHPNGKNLVNRAAAQPILEQLPHRKALFLAPIAGAHARAWSSSPPLVGFSRHATAHQVGTAQYNEANCLHAIMLCTSLLGFYQDLW